MALDGTYTGLKASVGDFLNRKDLTAVIPDFIAMAEAQIFRRLMSLGPVLDMMGRSDATIASEFVTVPDDFMGMRALYLTGSKKSLEVVDGPEKITERKTLYPNQDGDPKVFAIVGRQLQFWPWTGSASYPAELTYWKRATLSADNPTNWLLTLHPDAYLYGSCLQAAPYLKADDRLTVWANLLTTILADMVTADKNARGAPHLALSRLVSDHP